jgi:uncharacterized protein (TIGR03435 family)
MAREGLVLILAGSVVRRVKSGKGVIFAPAGWIAFGMTVLLACTTRTAPAQKAPDIAGTWQGTLQVDGGQRVVVKLAGAEKVGWKAVYYNFDSQAEGLGKLATSIAFESQSLRFAVGSIDVGYAGKLSNDGKSIEGTWTQSGLSHPLNLQRATEDTAWELPGADRNMPKDASPEFEVATIKPVPPNWDHYGYHHLGRRVWCDNETVNTMIQYAYGVSGRQIVGGPRWVSSDAYNVDGVPDIQGDPSVKQMLAMYQKLLADRFKLTIHHETRELAAYALTITKSSPKLAKSLGDPNGLPDETGDSDRTGITMRYTNTSMEDLADNLQAMMGDGKPVVEQTELTGRFDFTLKWTREQTQSADPNAAPGLFTAIQEQLGLKLEPVKAPVDVLVIDQVERPSAN